MYRVFYYIAHTLRISLTYKNPSISVQPYRQNNCTQKKSFLNDL